MSDGQHQAPASAFVPLLLLLLAALSWNTFQGVQLLNERNNLQAAIKGQETQMERSQKVRGALDSLATRTARLAKAGNANATVIVEELRRRGIAISPDGPPPAEPAAQTTQP